MAHDDWPLGVRIKTERAERHILEFNQAFQTFLQGNPYSIRRNKQRKPRQDIYIVEIRHQPPPELAGIAGDAFHNLRAALDLLAYQLASSTQRTNQTSFPIFKARPPTPQDLKASILEKVQRASKQVVRIFECIEPYQGGAGNGLWQLHCLDIIDKHRLLVQAFSANVGVGVDPLRTYINSLPRKERRKWAGMATPTVYARPAKRCPLEDGHILATVDPKVDKDPKFLLSIAFNEPGVIECEPAGPALMEFHDLVERVVELFLPFV